MNTSHKPPACCYHVGRGATGMKTTFMERYETMARIKPAEIFEHLNPQMRAALDEAVERTLPGVEVDRRKLYLEFRRALATRLKAWENVPASAVDAD